MSFHFFLSATNSLHLLTLSTWRSLSTSSFHLFLCLPLLLVLSSSWVEIFLGILSSSILSRWHNQLILCSFIHFTIFSPLFISSSSRFVRLFHSPFSCLGPYILLNIFRKENCLHNYWAEVSNGRWSMGDPVEELMLQYSVLRIGTYWRWSQMWVLTRWRRLNFRRNEDIKSKPKSFLTFREELAASVLSIQKNRLQFLFFEDGGTKLLRNTVNYLPIDVGSYPRRTIFIATVVRTLN